jgi:ketosteroid isomerase-like protein
VSEVRTPVDAQGPAERRRSALERVFLRLPRVGDSLVAALFRLPPASRLRRRWLAFSFRRGYAATNRRDYAVIGLALAPDYELTFHESNRLAPLDMRGTYRGVEGFRRVIDDWGESWENFTFEPYEVVDLGERMVLAVRMVGRGRGSGARLQDELFDVLTMRRGKLVRQVVYGDREAALAAARGSG